MERIDLILPPDPDNDDLVRRWDSIGRFHFVSGTLRDNRIIERARQHADEAGSGDLYDPITGFRLELVEQNGIWVYVSPDNDDFGFELSIPG